jgi:hypothetical protein
VSALFITTSDLRPQQGISPQVIMIKSFIIYKLHQTKQRTSFTIPYHWLGEAMAAAGKRLSGMAYSPMGKSDINFPPKAT